MTFRNFPARLATLLLAMAAGCTDLTVEPKSTITEANVFTDVNSYQALLAKVYAGLAVTGQQGPAGNADITSNDEGFSQYLRLYWEMQELPTDEAIIAWGDVGLPELNTQTWAVDNGFLINAYYRIFFQITTANEFLRQTTDAKLDGRGQTAASFRATIKQYRAEARFLRALSYWHAIDLFGNVPLVTEADPLGAANAPKQATRTELYNFAVSELTAILPDLPPSGAASYGRATGGAASMVLAKLYLNAAVYTGTANYAAALTASQAVIAGPYSLNPVFRNNFTADNNLSPEIIFAVTQDGLRTKTWGGMTFLVHAACGGSMDPNVLGIDGCWWGVRLKPEAYALITGDPRNAFVYTAGQTVAVTSVSDFTKGIAAPKYSNRTSTGVAGSHPTHPDTDFPMFRLADAYLMYAEAVLRGGGGSRAQALTYVNALRQRAYGNANGNITDADLTLNFILAERARELLWEGHRRNDLIRFGQFTGASYLWAWKGGAQAGTATGANLALFPLPANELIANPNLKQNPGY